MSKIQKSEQRLKTCLRRIDKLKENDKKLILKFKDEAFAQGLSNARVLHYLIDIQKISEWTSKDLDKLTEDEIKKLVSRIERKDYSEHTKKSYKLSIKKFYQFLEGYEWRSKEYPKKVKWIGTDVRKEKLKGPIILSKEEVKEIFRAAEGPLEKALASFMYESGCRAPDELLRMEFPRDVELLDGKAKVRLFSGKTGERKIIVVACLPYLREYLKEYKTKRGKKDGPLWVTKKRVKIKGKDKEKIKPLSYIQLVTLVKKWTKKAGIKKRVTPYTYRRSRATHLSTKFPTPILYKYMGWVPTSKVIDRYVSLNEEQMEETILGFYGMSTGKENNDIKPLFCSYCGQQNPPELEFCHWCHNPLTDMAKKKERETSIKSMLESMIEKKVKELQAGK
ncbi:MAG: tyrosine-type recombinase/integrase [archaeon]|nr:MAG: tyrosine-type recombinase/integrase [archaeon]